MDSQPLRQRTDLRWWQRPDVRTAIIGGFFVIVAALIPLVWPFLVRSADIEITRFDAIGVKQPGCAFELLLSNQSDRAILVTNAKIVFAWDSGLDALVPSSTYIVDTNVGPTGDIRGSATESESGVMHPLSGALNLHPNISWNLTLSVPLAESIESKKTDRVILIAAQSMNLQQKGRTLPNGSPSQLDLVKFLSEAKDFSANVTVTYDGKKTAGYRSILSLNSPRR